MILLNQGGQKNGRGQSLVSHEAAMPKGLRPARSIIIWTLNCD